MGKRHNLCQTRIYGIYYAIKKRCYNKNCDAYKNYGGRGIAMCTEWENSFMAFYNWAMLNGYKDDLTIDRIDVNGNYEPTNCRWVSRKIQNRNTRKNISITYNNKTQLMSDWSKEMNIPIGTLHRRFNQYDSLEYVFYNGNINTLINKQKRELKKI